MYPFVPSREQILQFGFTLSVLVVFSFPESVLARGILFAVMYAYMFVAWKDRREIGSWSDWGHVDSATRQRLAKIRIFWIFAVFVRLVAAAVLLAPILFPSLIRDTMSFFLINPAKIAVCIVFSASSLAQIWLDVIRRNYTIKDFD